MQAQSTTRYITRLVESFGFDDGQLPSLPDAIVYLERAIRDDSVSLARLAGLLATDPVLAARLIRVSNSSYYRAVSPVESVQDAVTRVGYSATRNIALVLLEKSFVARHPLIADKVSELWKESLCTAAVASSLSSQYELVDANRAMLGGLIYNVGPMLLLTKIDEKVASMPHRKVLDHMVSRYARHFGEQLLRYWDMDPDVVDVAANHDNWQRQHVGSPDLADLVLVARSCVPDADGVLPDLARCERLPCYQRIHRFMQKQRTLCEVVADAEASIAETLDMLKAA